ncbi:hypothetical protein KIW84_015262 [Lathyrus oleraceus]|uniref:Uncharacterized protein n=1 Tax=Pisum sativum TaxID=3888 RepID=A0A9D5BQN5_PEA|nr:hypothetical protein KIW84_015262 [Pisum sativum]
MKWQITSHQNKQNNPTRPKINLSTIITLPSQNLRCNISRSTTKSMKQTILSNLIRNSTQTKIRHFQITILIKQQILRLKIPMINTSSMTKPNRGNQLLKILSSNLFFQSTLRNLIKKLASTNILHHKINLCFRSHYLKQLDDVRMTNAAKNRDLTFYVCDQTTFQNFLLVDHLYSYAFTGFEILSVINLGECSMAKELPDFESTQ